MNPPQVYMCSPSWTLLPPPSPYHPSGSSQCTSPKHPGLNPLPVWQPNPVLLPGKLHGQRSPVGYSPWGRKESDTNERLHFTSLLFFLKCTVYFLCYWILRIIYSRYKTTIRYMICKYFLLVCGWIFNSLYTIL